MSNTTWGLQRDITPSLGARLVQEGNRLHYLADRVDWPLYFQTLFIA